MSRKNLLIFLLSLSTLALISAYISQFAFNYQPCILCLYQRVPFFIISILAVSTLLFAKQKKWQNAIIFSCIALLFINSVIAFYHVGVEKKFFKGFSGCSAANLDKIDNLENLKTAIMTQNLVRCDEPQFVFLSLSMAAWNLIYCTTTALIILLIYRNIRTRNSGAVGQK